MAELVVADAPYKTYPGGVIALKADEWMAGARGSLTAEDDVRASTGRAVRDTQTVTASIFSDPVSAFQEADDTLVVDLADLPVEADLRYICLVSSLIEGDWDASNSDTTRGGKPEVFNAACELGAYGDSTFYLSDSDFGTIDRKWRGLEQYRISSVGGLWLMGDVTGTEVLHFRAYAQSGTTIEWLIDQLIFLPYVTSEDHNGWEAGDFAIVPGQQGTFSGLYDISAGDWVDGADGGDDNGKYTWHPTTVSGLNPTGVSGSDGGGDYQRVATYADAEYMARVVEEDGYYLANTLPSPDVEAAAYCYGIHGPFHIPEQNWVTDAFARTVGDGNFAGANNHFIGGTWGDTPEGFAWRSDGTTGPTTNGSGNRTGIAVWADGSEGLIEMRLGNPPPATGSARVFLRTYGSETGSNIGADVQAENMSFAGIFYTTSTGSGASSSVLDIQTEENVGGGNTNALAIRFNTITGGWSLVVVGGGSTVAGPFTTPWYSRGDQVGFRIDLRRMRVLARVWDASGAEPSTWDADEFRPLRDGAVMTSYDYSGDLDLMQDSVFPKTVFIRHTVTTGDVNYDRLHFDNLTIDYDPLGDEESAFAAIEQPEGNKVAEIELPAGAQYLVYWGSRDWTVADGFGSYFLDFSSRVWNDPAAAELQRSEAVWWWFRSVHGGIVSMLWTSSTPVDITRIHQ